MKTASLRRQTQIAQVAAEQGEAPQEGATQCVAYSSSVVKDATCCGILIS